MSEQAGGDGFDAEGRLVPNPDPTGNDAAAHGAEAGDWLGESVSNETEAFLRRQADDEPRTERPALTISEAAEAAGVHRRTIRRHLDAGAFPNATKDAEGVWRVPVEDLLGAGLQLHAPSGPDPEPPPVAAVAPAEPAPAEPDEVARLRDRLADAERRAAVAEALADERARSLDDMRTALRALGAGPAPVVEGESLGRPAAAWPGPSAQPSTAPEVEAAALPEPRRRWWQRR